MRRIFGTLCLAAFCAGAFAALADAAPTKFDPNSFDADGDKILSPEELDAWEAAIEGNLPKPTAVFYQIELRRLRMLRGTDVPIALAEVNSNNCAVSGETILRKTVRGADLLSCGGIAATSDGASLSFTRDNEARTDTLTIAFGLAVPLSFGTGLVTPGTNFDRGAFLTERATAFYLEADGKLNAGAANEGFAEAGLLLGWRFEGGVFQQSIVTLRPYVRTDLDLDARIYGLRGDITPIHFSWGLGGQRATSAKPKPDRLFFWTLKGEVDGLWVEDPGSTGLQAKTEYVWLGAVGGLVYKNNKLGPHGIQATLGGSYHTDLLGGGDAFLGSAALSMFLDKKQSTAVQLTYKKGEVYQTDETKDELGLTFTLKF